MESGEGNLEGEVKSSVWFAFFFFPFPFEAFLCKCFHKVQHCCSLLGEL